MANVDDIDELIETRKLNGVDDGLYESDQNVATDEIDLTTVYMKGYADAKEKYRQKIKDKIEELKQKAISYGHLIDKDEAFKIECEINVLEELLEEK